MFIFFNLQLDKLKLQLQNIKEKLDATKSQVDTLCTLQDKQDGLLENIFNGDYGSELEDKLEEEVEVLMQKKQKISGIHMTWVNSRELISMSCAQLVYSVNRWKQISQYPHISNVVIAYFISWLSMFLSVYVHFISVYKY